MKKIVISVLLIFAMLLSGCASCKIIFGFDLELNGVTYEVKILQRACYVRSIRDSSDGSDKVVVLDEVLGCRVTSAGTNPFWGEGEVHVFCGKTDQVYLPWGIEQSASETSGNFKYIISASTQYIMYDYFSDDSKFVTPLSLYERIAAGERIGENRVEKENLKYYLPANIAFFFNYEFNPNEGYFFVDILEESGKITKPPYDPKREGFTFEGWYKDPECVNEWDFDTDEVVITFDEEGNRIYEEIKLYAKWIAER